MHFVYCVVIHRFAYPPPPKERLNVVLFHVCNIQNAYTRKQSTDIGKYCFANTTIKLWNPLPAETLVAGRCKSHVFRKRVREVIVIEEKK